MKIQCYLLLLMMALTSSLSIYANTITVKGYVKLDNGIAAKNATVNIAVYLANTTITCSEQAAVTNDEGFYTKDITCSGGDIKKTRISTKNCDGGILLLEKEVPTTKVVEANFNVCIATSKPCTADFTFESLPVSATIAALSVKFNSNVSSVAATDKIVSRVWDFRDGSALLTERVDPTHTYTKDGTYEVCLTIKTASGCESKTCKKVTLTKPMMLACTAKFIFEKLTPKKFRFNSSVSTVNPNDEIIERKWDFRDGTSSSDVSPAHEFPKFGNYEVCLNIKTASGCESRTCSVVKVEEAATTNDDPISIVSIYPVPTHENLKTVIFSKNNSIVATITIVNVDGVVQPIQQSVTLSQGNNPLSINVYKLPAGSYIYKIKTQSGTVSKPFYKL